MVGDTVAIIGIGCMLAGGVAAAILLHRSRRMTHLERMRALELGRPWPLKATAPAEGPKPPVVDDGHEDGSLARKAFSTATWVAFWGFLAAGGQFGMSRDAGGSHTGVPLLIAIVTGATCVVSVICGTVLALKRPVGDRLISTAKPYVEEDAFDVVSSRN